MKAVIDYLLKIEGSVIVKVSRRSVAGSPGWSEKLIINSLEVCLKLLLHF